MHTVTPAVCLAAVLLQDPTPEGWTARDVRGFRVVVKDAFRGHALHDEVLELIDHQLYQVSRAVPEPALSKLRDVTVWVGDEDRRHAKKCMFYHPSARWLRANDYPAFLAKGIEVANAANFLAWTHDQPWMVLHELAHAYHHQVVGRGHPALLEHYEAALSAGKYERVLRASGRYDRHYALTNAKEYFAEGSEALFGTNDFFPFVAAELRQHDPDLYTLLRSMWGLPARR